MARSLGVLFTIALSLGSTGCSFLFADAPPKNHQKMLYFDCTSTPGLEVADGMFGLLFASAGAQTLAQSDAEFEEMNEGGNRKTSAGTFLVTAGVFAGSAIYGIVVTENCSDAKANLRARIIEREQKRANPVVPAPPPATTAQPVGPSEPLPPGAPGQPAPAAPPAPSEPPPPVPPPAAPPAPAPTTPPPKPGAPTF